MLLCAAIVAVFAEPEPKKYKSEVKDKDKASTKLTDEERHFLREVEAKFGIKSDVPVEIETSKEEDELEEKKKEDEGDDSEKAPVTAKLPFPAVIAIELVNDTDVSSKGKKRTIDANLGYGYQTNNGYTYTYFGKEKAKYMIYPYSQEDIPPASSNSYSNQNIQTSDVEITPSRAYELIPAKEQEAYHYDKPAVEFKTKYENVQGVESPPPPLPSYLPDSSQNSRPTTLYTTYNGQQFSGLSGQFPSVQSNYLVDSSQLLKTAQYQSAGITQDYLRNHGASTQQRVVPVLVLRVPYSYLKNPSAEVFPSANVPQHQPISQYFNTDSLQELVNQYFKKLGYPYPPKVMTYQNSLSASVDNTVSAPIASHEPQQYANPYVQPSYTHADYSGVQYSAVQPVMARYPSGYSRQQYYFMRNPSSLYRQPVQQQYVSRYRYLPQSPVQNHAYYIQRPQYHQESYQVPAQTVQSAYSASDQQTSGHSDYGAHQHSSNEGGHVTSVEYQTTHTGNAPEYQQASVAPDYESVQTATASYEQPQEEVSHEYAGPTKVSIPTHHEQSPQAEYQQPEQKETIAIYPKGQAGHRYVLNSHADVSQSNAHQSQESEQAGLVLTENYPSKDHTIATVLPLSYKNRQNSEPVQSVSYITPVPHTMKYQAQYRVMGPQRHFKSSTSEKVAYVNSHSMPSYSSLSTYSREHNPEEEHTVGPQYLPPVGRQKPPPYPRNYHAHPRRSVKPDSKSDTTQRKQTEKTEKKKTS